MAHTVFTKFSTTKLNSVLMFAFVGLFSAAIDVQPAISQVSGVQSQAELQSRIDVNNPGKSGFVKDRPILGWSIKTDQFDDIPEAIGMTAPHSAFERAWTRCFGQLRWRGCDRDRTLLKSSRAMDSAEGGTRLRCQPFALGVENLNICFPLRLTFAIRSLIVWNGYNRIFGIAPAFLRT